MSSWLSRRNLPTSHLFMDFLLHLTNYAVFPGYDRQDGRPVPAVLPAPPRASAASSTERGRAMKAAVRALRAVAVVVGCLLFPPASGIQAQDWPKWNGPNDDLTTSRDGAFREQGFGVERTWSRPLGSGFSALSVVGDRLVTGYSDGASDWLVALDVETGRELWRYRMAEETYRGHDGSSDGPVATPTVHAGIVYGVTSRGRLFALRLRDGKEIWTRQLVEELGAIEPFWGFNSSPTVIGGVLVMQTGGTDGHSITALDLDTGELLWSTGDDAVYYESATTLRLGDEEQIFALTNEYILGLAPQTGDVLWRQEHKVDEGAYTGYMQPVPLGEGRVLVSAWTESVCLQVRKIGDSYRADEAWRTKVVTIAGRGAVPVPYQRHIYGFNGRFFSCIDAVTGETVWRSRSPGGGNLIAVDGHLVILARSGEVVVVEATPEGYREEARAQALEEGFYTRRSPAAASSSGTSATSPPWRSPRTLRPSLPARPSRWRRSSCRG
jgi:outer membrane protein assembly factor BamB